MSDKTKIEWSDATWNPITGCTKVSEGCRNCYALQFAERFRGTPGHYFENGFDVTLRPDKLNQPLLWKKPRKIFVNSMSDLFHDSVPFDYIFAVWARMLAAPQHTYQILTKRPKRMLEFFEWNDNKHGVRVETYLPNVWIGVSVENQAAADERIPLLLQAPVAVQFLSCEPLLGPVDLSEWIGVQSMDYFSARCGFFTSDTEVNNGYGCSHPEQEEVEDGQGRCHRFSCPIAHHLEPLDPEDAQIYKAFNADPTDSDCMLPHMPKLNWVIVGGESGHKARPMNPDWAKDIRDQCQAAGVSFFFKQWGEWIHNSHYDFKKYDGMSVRDEFSKLPNGLTHVDCYRKIGKHKAGRLLDGSEYNEMPNQVRG